MWLQATEDAAAPPARFWSALAGAGRAADARRSRGGRAALARRTRARKTFAAARQRQPP
jgi:hypothetical protein